MNQVDEQRNPRTKASVNQLMDRYLELLDVEETTHERYEQAIRIHIHIRPCSATSLSRSSTGRRWTPTRQILRSCRAHCDGRPFVEHAVAGPHECTAGCTHTRLSTAGDVVDPQGLLLPERRARPGIRWRWITVNQLDQAEPPRGATSDPDPPTAEQAQQILSCVANRRNGARFALALALSLRKGEALGLKWSRVDLDGVTLRPSRPKRHGGGLHEVDVKSRAGRRVVGIPAPVLALLKAHRVKQAEERRAAGSEWREEGWVFTQPNGRPIDPRADHGEWKAVLADAGVRDARLHDARHTAATMLLVRRVASDATPGAIRRTA